jgi:DNA polymerase-3 subunit gamma/tau
MAQALYRKYRPQTFGEVTDQNHIKITIQNQIATGDLAHAYLLAGPRGVGKTTIARLLARAVNCEQRAAGQSEPCNVCSACQDSLSGRALDVIEIDAASNTGVDHVRENIIEAVRFAPSAGKYKVFIIDEAHMLSTAAFNALLKTLEEPPAKVIFVLATTEIHKIPATILSRCQRFDFHRVATPDIIARLKNIAVAEGVEVVPEVLSTMARLSEGGLRDAESLLGQILALGEKKIGLAEASIILPVTNLATVVELMDAIARQDTKSALATLNTFVDQGGSIRHLTDELIDFTRTMLMVGLQGPTHDHYDGEAMTSLKRCLELMPVSECRDFLDALIAARSRPAPDAFPQLPLELVIATRIGSNHLSTKTSVIASAEPLKKAKGPETVTEPIKGPPAKEGGLKFTLDELQSKWKRCCEAIGRRNIALPLVLQSATPTAVLDDLVTITFTFAFHYETAGEAKNIAILQAGIGEIVGTPVRVKIELATVKESEVVGELIAAFGGEVVE